MVDPQANVYIVSRVDDGRGILFQLPSSAWGTGQKVLISSTAVIYAPSTHHDPVGGDISPNGKEVLIKVYCSCLITICDLIVTKPVFGGFLQSEFQPVSSATETS